MYLREAVEYGGQCKKAGPGQQNASELQKKKQRKRRVLVSVTSLKYMDFCEHQITVKVKKKTPKNQKKTLRLFAK